MNEDEKKQIANCMITRVETGFQFINDKYLVPQRNACGPDIGWLRNIYILFSFYSEILLKSGVVLFGSFIDKSELNIKLKKLGHNMVEIGRELGEKNLQTIGIQNISFVKGEYVLEMADKMVYIKDFNDIRYDFIGGKVRSVLSNEDSVIAVSLEGAYKIKQIIKNRYF